MVILCSHQDVTKVLFHVIYVMNNNVLITRKTYTHDCNIHAFQQKMCIYCFIEKSYIYNDNVKKFLFIIVCYKSCYVHDLFILLSFKVVMCVHDIHNPAKIPNTFSCYFIFMPHFSTLGNLV
jgi:hypothetical protein